MRKVLVSAAVATTLVGILAGTAQGRGVLLGIPSEARVTSYRLKLSDPSKPTSIDTFDMYGAWTDHAYFVSWDKKHVVFQRFLGLGIRAELDGSTSEFTMSSMNSREVTFSPDSHHFVVSENQGTMVVDATNPGENGEVKQHALYSAQKGIKAYAGCWAPDSSGFFILEEDWYRKQPGSRLRAIPTGGGSGHVVLDHPARVRWFMVPDSRYRAGQGPIKGAWKLLFAATDGLWVMNHDGSGKEKISTASPDIFQDVEWSPTSDVLLAVTREQLSVSGIGTFLGVYLIHPDKAKGGKPSDVFETVDGAPNVHSIYFSPKGKYLSWATPNALKVREVAGKPESATTVDFKDERGQAMEVRQFAWDDKETRLLVTAKNRVYLYDVAKKTKSLVAKIEDDVKTITADPVWLSDDEFLIAAFTDIAAPFKR